jgi:hypothetical protein
MRYILVSLFIVPSAVLMQSQSGAAIQAAIRRAVRRRSRLHGPGRQRGDVRMAGKSLPGVQIPVPRVLVKAVKTRVDVHPD